MARGQSLAPWCSRISELTRKGRSEAVGRYASMQLIARLINRARDWSRKVYTAVRRRVSSASERVVSIISSLGRHTSYLLAMEVVIQVIWRVARVNFHLVREFSFHVVPTWHPATYISFSGCKCWFKVFYGRRIKCRQVLIYISTWLWKWQRVKVKGAAALSSWPSLSFRRPPAGGSGYSAHPKNVYSAHPIIF